VDRRTIGLGIALVVAVVQPPLARGQGAPSGAKALERLKAGNDRFAADKPAPRIIGKDRRQELAQGQHPFAVILTCADSRVTPELVFDTGLGDLFVLRVAGNIADQFELGSIEFAVEHLQVPLIVVMGHESCGAVKAALDGGRLEGNLAGLIKMVDVGRDLPRDPKAALDAAIRNNVVRQVQLLTEKSKVIKELAESKRLEIAGGVYALGSGKVEWIDTKSADGIKTPPAKKKTTITVRVPTAEARVWIDDKETTSRGTSRAFETPALAAGREYSYLVKAAWVERGREVTREKTVSFKAGEPLVVEFKE
jgi:carbonic anhydrase